MKGGADTNINREQRLQKSSKSEGLVIGAGTPEELDCYVRGEEARWRKIVTENKIAPE